MEPIRLAAGVSLGRYEILEHLASGGMAEVYLGRRTGIGGFARQVVLKTIRASFSEDDAYVRMFLDEARIAGSLNHPNVASVYEADEIDGVAFLVMEYVPGPSLSRLVHFAQQLGRPDRVAVAWLIAGAARGLNHVHNIRSDDGELAGLVHRDISLDNILASRDGNAKVIDFGIALARERLTQTAADVVKGKLGYVAPEQIAGRPVDHRADLFALGVCLYRATVGAPPFANTDITELLRVRLANEFARPGEIDPHFPPALEVIILKAMASEPDDRYASGAQLAGDLEAWLRAERPDFEPAQVANFIASSFHSEADWRRRLPQPRSQPPSSTSLAGSKPTAPPPDAVPAPEAAPGEFAPWVLLGVGVVVLFASALILSQGYTSLRSTYAAAADAIAEPAVAPATPASLPAAQEPVAPPAAAPEPPSATPQAPALKPVAPVRQVAPKPMDAVTPKPEVTTPAVDAPAEPTPAEAEPATRTRRGNGVLRQAKPR